MSKKKISIVIVVISVAIFGVFVGFSQEKLSSEPQYIDGISHTNLDLEGITTGDFLDTDGDAVPDHIDACPLERETHNKFQDEDGCPDELGLPITGDLDHNGIVDYIDFCISQGKRGISVDGCPVNFGGGDQDILEMVDVQNIPEIPEIPQMPNLELIEEIFELGCTEPAINHALRYSNLLDDSFDGTYFIEWIGLPDNLSQAEFDKCVKIILEKRISEGLENEN